MKKKFFVGFVVFSLLIACLASGSAFAMGKVTINNNNNNNNLNIHSQRNEFVKTYIYFNFTNTGYYLLGNRKAEQNYDYDVKNGNIYIYSKSDETQPWLINRDNEKAWNYYDIIVSSDAGAIVLEDNLGKSALYVNSSEYGHIDVYVDGNVHLDHIGDRYSENSYTLNIKPYNGPNDILKTTYIDLANTGNTLITSLNINIENQTYTDKALVVCDYLWIECGDFIVCDNYQYSSDDYLTVAVNKKLNVNLDANFFVSSNGIAVGSSNKEQTVFDTTLLNGSLDFHTYDERHDVNLPVSLVDHKNFQILGVANTQSEFFPAKTIFQKKHNRFHIDVDKSIEGIENLYTTVNGEVSSYAHDGENVCIHAEVATGYKFDKFYAYDMYGNELDVDSEGNFKMPDCNVVVSASTIPIGKYDIKITSAVYGKINAPEKSFCGDINDISYDPTNLEYRASRFIVVGDSGTEVDVEQIDNKATFQMPDEPVTVSVIEKEKEYDINKNYIYNGVREITTISSGYITSKEKRDKYVEIDTDIYDGYEISGYSVIDEDGNNVEVDNNGHFQMPNKSVTVSVDTIKIDININIDKEYENIDDVNIQRVAKYNDIVEFTVTPGHNHRIDACKFVADGQDPVEAKDLGDNHYSFKVPSWDVRLEISTEMDGYAFIYQHSEGVESIKTKVYDEQVWRAFEGYPITLSATPIEGFTITEYKVQNVFQEDIELDKDNTFIMPKYDVFIFVKATPNKELECNNKYKYNKPKDELVTSSIYYIDESGKNRDTGYYIIGDRPAVLDEDFSATSNPGEINIHSQMDPLIITGSDWGFTWKLNIDSNITNFMLSDFDNKGVKIYTHGQGSCEVLIDGNVEVEGSFLFHNTDIESDNISLYLGSLHNDDTDLLTIKDGELGYIQDSGDHARFDIDVNTVIKGNEAAIYCGEYNQYDCSVKIISTNEGYNFATMHVVDQFNLSYDSEFLASNASLSENCWVFFGEQVDTTLPPNFELRASPFAGEEAVWLDALDGCYDNHKIYQYSDQAYGSGYAKSLYHPKRYKILDTPKEHISSVTTEVNGTKYDSAIPDDDIQIIAALEEGYEICGYSVKDPKGNNIYVDSNGKFIMPKSFAYIYVDVMPVREEYSIEVLQKWEFTEGSISAPATAKNLDTVKIEYSDLDKSTFASSFTVMIADTKEHLNVTQNGNEAYFIMPKANVEIFAVVKNQNWDIKTNIFTKGVDNIVIKANGNYATAAARDANVQIFGQSKVGYEITGYDVKTETGDAIKVNDDNTFVMPNCNVSISAKVQKLKYRINTDLSYEGVTVVVCRFDSEYGQGVDFKITPQPGYVIDMCKLSSQENQDIIAHDINGNHWYFIMPSWDVHVDIQASKRNSTGINGDVNLHENKKIDVLDDKLVIGNKDNNKSLNNNNNTQDDNNKFDLSDNSNDQEVSLEFDSVSSDLESVVDNNGISNDSTAIFFKQITSVLPVFIIGIIVALLACIPVIFIKKLNRQ